MKTSLFQSNRFFYIFSAISFFLIFARTEAVTTARIATGFNNPLFAVSPPGDGRRLFIGEQNTGRIRILNLLTRQINGTDFLDINDLQSTGFEQGLLGMAFDPNYAENGYFYVNLTKYSIYYL